MNKTIIGIIIGIIITLAIIGISISLTLFYIYYNQPDFLCDLCKCSDPFIFDWFP